MGRISQGVALGCGWVAPSGLWHWPHGSAPPSDPLFLQPQRRALTPAQGNALGSTSRTYHTKILNARSPFLSIKGRLTLKASSCILDSETENKALRGSWLAAAQVFAFGIVDA